MPPRSRRAATALPSSHPAPLLRATRTSPAVPWAWTELLIENRPVCRSLGPGTGVDRQTRRPPPASLPPVRWLAGFPRQVQEPPCQVVPKSTSGTPATTRPGCRCATSAADSPSPAHELWLPSSRLQAHFIFSCSPIFNPCLVVKFKIPNLSHPKRILHA